MEKLGQFLLLMIVFCFSGIVFVHMWGWFVVPLGVVSLSFFNALGIMFLHATIFTYSKRVEFTLKDFVSRIIYLSVGLGFGFIIQLFM